MQVPLCPLQRSTILYTDVFHIMALGSWHQQQRATVLSCLWQSNRQKSKREKDWRRWIQSLTVSQLPYTQSVRFRLHSSSERGILMMVAPHGHNRTIPTHPHLSEPDTEITTNIHCVRLFTRWLEMKLAEHRVSCAQYSECHQTAIYCSSLMLANVSAGLCAVGGRAFRAAHVGNLV